MSIKVSIITATFNSASTVSGCLESILSQSLGSQHIVIDGGSTDGTLDIIRSYPHVATIVSEPDNGIYDAMNKGIVLSTGNVIGILNSDDFYAHNHVLEKVVERFKKNNIDSCYGDLQYVNADDPSKVLRHWESGDFTPNCFLWGWMPPHPTFFVRRRVYEKYGRFNLDLGSAADYELMLRFLVKQRISTTYLPEVLVKMRSGGVSNSSFVNRIKANRMDRLAWDVNALKPFPWTIWMKPLRKIVQYLAFYSRI